MTLPKAGITLLCTLLLATAARAQCDAWHAGPPLEFPGLSGTVKATAIWDPDGQGPLPPQLVIGGSFSTADGVPVHGIAHWDGSAWQPFGDGMAGSVAGPCEVKDLAVLPPSFGSLAGQLVAAGDFITAGGVTAHGLARWDGAAWQPFPGWAESAYVNALAIAPGGAPFSGELLLAGRYVGIVGTGFFVAHWDGSTIIGLGFGPILNSHEAHAITFWDPDGRGPLPPQLVIAGELSDPPNNTIHNVAVFGGGTWQPLGSGLGGQSAYDAVLSLATIPDGDGPFAGQLVAGGVFGQAGSTIVHNVARWDGSAWQPMGAGLNSIVNSFTTWDPDGSGPLSPQLVAGGSSYASGATEISPGVARWDGGAWQSIGTGVRACDVVATYTPTGQPTQLLAGGEGLTNGSQDLGALATFTTAAPAWVPFAPGGAGTIFALSPYRNRMIAGGSFSSSTGGAPHNMAAWDGLDDEPLGGGFNNSVRALKSYNTGVGVSQFFHLVAAGDFTTAGGAAANRVAIWSESANVNINPSWTAMGTGFNGTVNALERFNNDIYAGGVFTAAGSGSPALSHIAQWNGSAWQQLATTLDGTVFALKVYNGQLYAGGSFTHAGGLASGGLARWNGTAWSVVGGNFNGTVLALEVYNGDLIIGGTYPGITGNPNIAKYNSVTGVYSTLGSGGTDSSVRALLAESGNLYVGGNFTQAGGVAAPHLARWNGVSWSGVRGGTDGVVFALAASNNEVHAGGSFLNVGAGIASISWGRYLETGAPWFAYQPITTTADCGSEVRFLALVPTDLAAGLSVTWRHNGVPLSDGPTAGGSSIFGSQTQGLLVANAGLADQGDYDVVAGNSCGGVTSSTAILTVIGCCGSADFNCDGDIGTDADIEAFFTCLAGDCPSPPCFNSADFNGDGDIGTDADIEAFFRVLAGGTC